MGSALVAARVFSPLDDELGLLPGGLTPSLQESLVRLGTWMPFERAAIEFKHFTRTDVSEPSVRRTTEAAGAAYVQVQTQAVERLEHVAPPPPSGPAKLFLSVDGAMVPLVGGEWAEVKTMVIGEVKPPVQIKGERVVQTTNHSYFSRLTDSETFRRLALVETHRRGVETAKEVGVVTDGSEWIQTFVDFHRPDAKRILDFPHAGEHIYPVGQAVFGEGSPAAQSWLATQLHQLKHIGPAPVLAELRQILATHPHPSDLDTHVAYLEKRQAHMDYPVFQAAGWPIGDGAVESGNKLVVEARLKGSGMHWARSHVDPMLALRNIACNDRWEEAWPQIVLALCQQDRQRRTEQRQKHRARCAAILHPLTPPSPSDPEHLPSTALIPLVAEPLHLDQPSHASPLPKPAGPWRPPPNHPWRHMPVGRARFNLQARRRIAKT